MASSLDSHIINAQMLPLPLIPQMNNYYNNCDDQSTLSIPTAETSTTPCPFGCGVLKKETSARDFRAHAYRYCKKVKKEHYPFIYLERFVNDPKRMVQGQKDEYPTELHELMDKNMDDFSPEIRKELLNFKTEVFDPVENTIKQKKRQKKLQKKLQSDRKLKEVLKRRNRNKKRSSATIKESRQEACVNKKTCLSRETRETWTSFLEWDPKPYVEEFSSSQSSDSKDKQFRARQAIKPRSLSLLDIVRVKKSVKRPCYHWGSVTHQHVGHIMTIDGRECTVNFEYPTVRKGWYAMIDELEVCEMPMKKENFIDKNDSYGAKVALNVLRRMRDMRNDNSNVKIIVEPLNCPGSAGGCMILQAHRGLLSAWSRAFREKFASEIKDEITIKTEHPDCFRDMLDIMYDPSIEPSERNMISMLNMATKWKVDDILSRYEEFIKNATRLSNVVDIWAAADQAKSETLQKHCARFAANNIRDCHEDLPIDHLIIALKRDDLCVGDENEALSIVCNRLKKLTEGSVQGAGLNDRTLKKSVQLLETIRTALLNKRWLECKDLKDDKGSLRGEFMRALLKNSHEGVKRRFGLKYESADELRPKMYVRISASVPAVIAACHEKFLDFGACGFVPEMYKYCGKLVQIEEVQKHHVRLRSLSWPIRALERASGKEIETMEGKRSHRVLEEGDLVDVWIPTEDLPLTSGDNWNYQAAVVKKASKEERAVLLCQLGDPRKKASDPMLMRMDSPRILEYLSFSHKSTHHDLSGKQWLQQLEFKSMSVMGKALNGSFEASRKNADDPFWPPLELGSVVEKMSHDFKKSLSVHEVAIRRMAQLTNADVVARITYPCFKGDSLETERQSCLEYFENENFFKVDKNLRQSICLLWEGKRNRTTLTRGLLKQSGVLIDILLVTARIHEDKTEKIKKSPDIIVSRAREELVNGLYKKTGFEERRPKYQNDKGMQLLFSDGKWQIKGAKKEESNFNWAEANGYFPPIGDWDSQGSLHLRFVKPHKFETKSKHARVDVELATSHRNGRVSDPSESKDHEMIPMEISPHDTKTITLLTELTEVYSNIFGKNAISFVVEEFRNCSFDVDTIAEEINLVGFNVDAIIKSFIERNYPTNDSKSAFRALETLSDVLELVEGFKYKVAKDRRRALDGLA
uniref:BTB domain-containing protein n=1 Tax=Amorphochlora amoebiformis TaxID=1561963 RepID=A0A7S0DH26_9EUKA|mmetsp:Transcript_27643/g.43881  ORF Transcript_27643/g.43881 Transcript_27643/m.43881 type:complete len:1149 (+) Transcript_27643:80-3526(+)